VIQTGRKEMHTKLCKETIWKTEMGWWYQNGF